jgi:dihydroxy-acid dehydratase
MSGTGFGTVVLHVSPEAAAGGALALIRNGDMITLDVHNRRLHADITPGEMERRKAAWKPAYPQSARGYVQLYQRHVEQAHLGADLDFLKGSSGSEVTRDSH